MADNKKALRKKRGTARAQFHRFFNAFYKEDISITKLDGLTAILSDLERAYKEVESKHKDYSEALDSDDETDKEELDKKEQDMEIIYEELCKARSEVANLQKLIKSSASMTTATEQLTSERSRKATESLKVKRLEFPTFSGKIRDYPSFKNEFDAHVISSYGKDPYALKGCLSGEALDTVKGVDNDFEEMFRRLDLKYGRPERLTDAVLSELKKLKRVPEDDTKKFINMVDVVERCWLDLKRLGLESEMNTTVMISQIERLLPNVQKREWSLQKHRAESRQAFLRFPDFLGFLLEEKIAMEYMEDDMRESKLYTSSKIHNAVIDGICEESSTEAPVRNLQDQIQENQKAIQKVIEGLAQVTKVISQPSSSTMPVTSSLNASRKKCWFHNSDNHDIEQCSGFASQDNQAKIDLIKRNGACFCCLKTGHIARACTARKLCGAVNPDGIACNKYHHQLLHLAMVQGAALHSKTDVNHKPRQKVLLMISKVQCRNQDVNVLWDPGANVSLISHEAARRLGLKGTSINLSITKVGNTTEHISSKEYTLPLTDENGKVWNIPAYGMQEVTTDIEEVNTTNVAGLFPEISSKDILRPKGKVEILIGSDCCDILPNKVNQAGSLQLMKNQFGYCLRGSHSSFGTQNSANNVVVKIHLVGGKVSTVDELSLANVRTLKEDLDLFFEVDSLGTNCSPRCGGCRCGKCAIGDKKMSMQEERELELIKKGLSHDAEKKEWTCHYPWIRDPKELPNNYSSAFSRLRSLENRLKKLGKSHTQVYDTQIKDMVERGIAKILSSNEILNHDGPVHYIPHHEVLKPGSPSTPVRIVFNSSASHLGHKLNNYWAKGPNLINDLFGVLLRFRQDYVAMINDISKMYHTIKLSPLDQDTHRFLWRNMNQIKQPDHYKLSAVTFGDKPSGTISILALQQTAEMKKEEYPEAVNMIKKNIYVDDILKSVKDVKTAQKLASEVEMVLATGGFRLKNWIYSRKGSVPEANNVVHDNYLPEVNRQEKVLGMDWDPIEDVFRFKVKLQENDNTKSSVNVDSPESLTRRMVVSQAARVYDPLGLVIPATLIAKILIRKICTTDNGQSFGWDDELPETIKKEWLEFLYILHQIEALHFPRCVKPENAIEESPSLVIFSDGSKIAYGACAYIRWKISTGEYQSSLVTAKNRIAPKRQLTIPRTELCGAVLASRLRESICQEMELSFSMIIHLVDSTIVQAQIQKESHRFKPFVASRLSEIQEKTQPSEWACIPGDENPADLTTRITHPNELVQGSMWQCGPEFLKKPIESWPIRRETASNEVLPDKILTIMNVSGDVQVTMPNEVCVRMIIQFKSYKKLIYVTALVLKIKHQKSFFGAAQKINSEDLKNAEQFWIKEAQKSLPVDWRVNDLVLPLIIKA